MARGRGRGLDASDDPRALAAEQRRQQRALQGVGVSPLKPAAVSVKSTAADEKRK
jgi:hypothetical protein